jgi:hypothetical protein
MKAISLWQPWASLWLSDAKVHETRHWPTSHRGWLAVHAAKRRIDDFSGDRLDEICDGIWGNHWGLELPRGAIIGAVKIVACKPTVHELFGCTAANDDDRECGDFSEGRYAWERSDFHLLTEPIPYRGQQGMFAIPDDLFPPLWELAVN